jgi:hypothetical protein
LVNNAELIRTPISALRRYPETGFAEMKTEAPLEIPSSGILERYRSAAQTNIRSLWKSTLYHE